MNRCAIGRKTGRQALKRLGKFRLRVGRTPDHIPSVDGVLAWDTFLGVLRRERARASRNSHGFSVVAFRYPADGQNGPITHDERLLRLLVDKVRLTDAVGILSDDEVGVFLPETHARGAQVFANRIQQMARSAWAVQSEYKVFCYPDEYREDWSDHDSRQLRFVFDAPDTSAREIGAAPLSCPMGGEGGGMDAYLAQSPPVWKRGFDLIMATIGVVLAAPILLVIALHIKMTSRGPVLFKQDRIGYLGKGFKCYKFRTMHLNCETSTHQNYLKDLIRSEQSMTKLDEKRDPRIIPFGRLFRLSGLDELPQLFNVLRGEMSLVGPRPCIPYEYDEYDVWHRMRTEMRPGLTGLWQVSGKNKTTFTEMIRYDIAYARRLSPWRDFLIVLKTIPAMIVQMFG